MKENYLWQVEEQAKVEALTKDEKTDILIIGGGIAGMSIAFALKDLDEKILVVDQHQCGNGVTMRTTGKLTSLQNDIYQTIEKSYGKRAVKLYFQSQQEAIQIVKSNVQTYDIDCNFEEVDSYLFIRDEKNKEKLRKEKESLKSITTVLEKDTLPISYPIIKTIQVSHSAVFHPLKYLLALKKLCSEKGVFFYEDTMVHEIIPRKDCFVVNANNHKIIAKKVIVSCHYPFFLLPSFIPFKTYLEKSYIGSFKVNDNKHFSAINLDQDTYSFRYHQDKENIHFLYLSESHKLSDDVDYLKKVENLKQKIERDFHQVPDYIWSNYDLMTNDSLPFIGRISKEYPNLFLVTGFNTWGMTNGVISGKVIHDLILEKENAYISLFDPMRHTTPTKLINNLINDFKMAKIFLKTKIKKNYSFYPDQVKIITRNGKKCGVYIDQNKKEHVVSNTCPHMKCSLIFNPTTTSWDCPCHGSRFDIDGNVLKGPSTWNIKIE